MQTRHAASGSQDRCPEGATGTIMAAPPSSLIGAVCKYRSSNWHCLLWTISAGTAVTTATATAATSKLGGSGPVARSSTFARQTRKREATAVDSEALAGWPGGRRRSPKLR